MREIALESQSESIKNYFLPQYIAQYRLWREGRERERDMVVDFTKGMKFSPFFYHVHKLQNVSLKNDVL
jgi:hypothetical protein